MPPWLVLSLTTVPLFGLVWLAPKFFIQNFQVKAEAFLVWYCLGVAVALMLMSSRNPEKKIFLPLPVIAAIFLIGALIGATANVLMFRAMPLAPSPGLPVSISCAGTIITLLGSCVLAWFLPQFFTAPTVTVNHWIGSVLMLLGLFVFAK